MSEFRIGAKVLVEVSPGFHVEGTIKAIDFNSTKNSYYVRFDDGSLGQWYFRHDLSLIDYIASYCDCGSDKLGHPGHSHWCSSLQEPSFTFEFQRFD